MLFVGSVLWLILGLFFLAMAFLEEEGRNRFALASGGVINAGLGAGLAWRFRSSQRCDYDEYVAAQLDDAADDTSRGS